VTTPDDTQPRRPQGFPPPADRYEPYDEDDGVAGPGCFMIGLLTLMALGLAGAIVLLAGAAGWTEGQNEGDRIDAAAERADVGIQLTRIPDDVASRNSELAGMRLNYLETLIPDDPAVGQIRATVTALVSGNATATLDAAIGAALTPVPEQLAAGDLFGVSNALAYVGQIAPDYAALPALQATATAAMDAMIAANQPTATPDAPAVVEEITEEPVVQATTEPLPTAAEGGFDLNRLLREAETALSAGRYEDAYDTLDAIQNIDDSFQPAEVQGLLRQTLTAWANALFSTDDNLPEAIRVTDLLESSGGALGELDYERFIAGLYVDAQTAIGLGNHPLAIQRLNEIRSFQQEYKGNNINRLVFNEYVNYAEDWQIGGQPCQAVTQFDRALQLFNDAGVQGQRDTAQRQCEQGATPTPGAGETPAAGGISTPAPIGVPGT